MGGLLLFGLLKFIRKTRADFFREYSQNTEKPAPKSGLFFLHWTIGASQSDERLDEMKKVSIYDTTLRDGSQAKGIAFSLEDKLSVARKLDEIGVSYIEGGWPNPTNPLDVEFFARAQRMEW